METPKTKKWAQILVIYQVFLKVPSILIAFLMGNSWRNVSPDVAPPDPLSRPPEPLQLKTVWVKNPDENNTKSVHLPSSTR